MFFFTPIYSDTPLNYSFGFQDPASKWMLGIIELHDNIVFYLIIVLSVVLWFFISSMRSGQDHLSNLAHGNLIEVIWTIAPALILWVIGLPSLKLLYKMDEILDAELTVKAIGNQWYWSYEYSDYVYANGENNEPIAFDSYMVAEDDLELGELRELSVDNYLVLPINTSIRLLISSNDVIHSFSVPSLGIKMDALPGRFTINNKT